MRYFSRDQGGGQNSEISFELKDFNQKPVKAENLILSLTSCSKPGLNYLSRGLNLNLLRHNHFMRPITRNTASLFPLSDPVLYCLLTHPQKQTIHT